MLVRWAHTYHRGGRPGCTRPAARISSPRRSAGCSTWCHRTTACTGCCAGTRSPWPLWPGITRRRAWRGPGRGPRGAGRVPGVFRPPHAIDTVLAPYRKEGTRLAATAEAVDLVERALRGEEFTPKMSLPPTAPERQSAEPEGTEPARTG